MRRHSNVVVGAVVAALLVACAATPPSSQRPIEQRALADLRTVDALYFSTLTAVGDLHRAGKLDDNAYAAVLRAAEAVRVAREAAASALLAYLSVAPTSDGAGRARAALETALARLAASALQLRTEALK